jgi:hypothetical protein
MAQAGFVLPTTVLLVLMVVLTATALTYRTISRSQMNIAQREQVRVANVASPAVDRAKSKIEFIFTNDTRLTSGLPTPEVLASMMLATPYPDTVSALVPGKDPFTLPGETRLDINGDGTLDNAWSFVDSNTNETVAYSILVEAEGLNDPTITVTSPVNIAKARALVTRSGPVASTSPSAVCSNARAEGGWQVVDSGSSSTLQKNFQINVFVPNSSDVNRTLEAFEFQQSRIAERGNKWAAWFRYDLDIDPGSSFTINGAMHTDSNLFVSGPETNSKFEAFKISSENSCVYGKEASEITVGVGTSTNTFEGQIVRGSVVTNAYDTTAATKAIFHIWDGDDKAPKTDATLTTQNDSVNGATPGAIAVNPLKLFAEDKLEPIGSGWSRDNAAWESNPIRSGGTNGAPRVFNRRMPKPFVDDLFRADNRWGPKPRYSETIASLDITNTSNKVGNSIDSSLKLLNDEQLGLDGFWERQAIANGLRLIVGERLELGDPLRWNSTDAPDTPTNTNRLYPPNAAPRVPATGTPITIGTNEYRQKRSLRDNLAAVQGMVVYHYKRGSGKFPAACVAFTSHPGTLNTIVNSRTFDSYSKLNTSTNIAIKTDFFNGVGTDGWEFSFPSTFSTASGFATEIASTKPLGIALRNLARFAGDPKGGAPSFTAFQDSDIHPAPYFNMWGDFSPLRRVLADIDGGTDYDELSFADQATLHSAACTVSMLAYNTYSDYLQATKDLEDYVPTGLNAYLNQVVLSVQNIADYMDRRRYLNTGMTGPNRNTGNDAKVEAALIAINKNQAWTDPNPATVITAGTPALCPAGTDAAGFQANCDAAEFFSQFTFEQWVEVMEGANGLVKTGSGDSTNLVALSDVANRINFILRDRDFGFKKGVLQRPFDDADPSGNAVTWDDSTGLVEPVGQGGGNYVYATGCDPNIFSKLVAGGDGGQSRVAIGGLIGCSERNSLVYPIRFPALYYLFPTVNHDHNGTGTHAQPATEEYVNDAYVKSVNPDQDATTPPAATAYTYQVVGTDPVKGISEIAAVPRKADISDWVLPVTSNASLLTTTTIDASPFRINRAARQSDGTTVSVTAAADVAILDKGIFDGREQLAVRVADLSMAVLTSTDVPGTTEKWIPDTKCIPSDTVDCNLSSEGIVYAFREDAVREDEIVRPKNANAKTPTSPTDNITAPDVNCLTIANITSDTCQIKTAVSPQDPPLTATGISLKPVDYYADPDRRPHGFRLRNGADMSNGKDRDVGMTFVTDNSVYIMGDFNLHSTAGTTATLIEEFTEKLDDDAWVTGTPSTGQVRFYGPLTSSGPGRKNLDPNFARSNLDTWRPVEILADAFTMISNGFLDGSVQDTFTMAWPSGPVATNTSYMNQSRPDTAQNVRREDGTSSSTSAASPVWIDRNGSAWVGSNQIEMVTPLVWRRLTDTDNDRRKNLNLVSGPVRVNAVLIGGIVPSRTNQGYGGLPNFPRTIQHWGSGTAQPLIISGSFLQLNFSTASTGPFEHDAWEPGAAPDDDSDSSTTGPKARGLGYYSPSTRRWGYDPALLYYPPAAASRRFASVGNLRSEYFRDLPADDPYVQILRCAKDKDSNFVYPADIRGTCPA